MWSHSLVVGIDGTAVCVGTDDADLAALLQPWRIDEPAELVDFAAELYPPRPVERAAPRPLPSLRHGTAVIGRSPDPGPLRDGLLRILASFAAPTPPGCVRITGLPLVRDGAVELVPLEVASALPHGWLRAQSLSAVYAHSVVVDPMTPTVRIDAPLGRSGSEAGATVLPLRRWWVTGLDPDSRDGDVTTAQLVARAASRLTGATVDNAALATLVTLVEQLPPERKGLRW